MKQAAKKQLLNAQKVDGAIISEENGAISFRKAPWNDSEVICEQPKHYARAPRSRWRTELVFGFLSG